MYRRTGDTWWKQLLANGVGDSVGQPGELLIMRQLLREGKARTSGISAGDRPQVAPRSQVNSRISGGGSAREPIVGARRRRKGGENVSAKGGSGGGGGSEGAAKTRGRAFPGTAEQVGKRGEGRGGGSRGRRGGAGTRARRAGRCRRPGRRGAGRGGGGGAQLGRRERREPGAQQPHAGTRRPSAQPASAGRPATTRPQPGAEHAWWRRRAGGSREAPRTPPTHTKLPSPQLQRPQAAGKQSSLLRGRSQLALTELLEKQCKRKWNPTAATDLRS